MKESKHTQGPWKVDTFCVWGGTHGDAYVAATLTGICEEEQRANARLIAASPTMYEALKALVDWDTEHDGIYSQHNPAVGRLVAQAKAALDKAEKGN